MLFLSPSEACVLKSVSRWQHPAFCWLFRQQRRAGGRVSVTAVVAPNFSVAEPLFSEGRHFLRDNTVGCAKTDVVLGNSSGWRHSQSPGTAISRSRVLLVAAQLVPRCLHFLGGGSALVADLRDLESQPVAQSGVPGWRRRWAGEPAARLSQVAEELRGRFYSQRRERRRTGSGLASRTQSPGGGAARVSVAGLCGFARRWLLGSRKFGFRGACDCYLLSKSIAKM